MSWRSVGNWEGCEKRAGLAQTQRPNRTCLNQLPCIVRKMAANWNSGRTHRFQSLLGHLKGIQQGCLFRVSGGVVWSRLITRRTLAAVFCTIQTRRMGCRSAVGDLNHHTAKWSGELTSVPMCHHSSESSSLSHLPNHVLARFS
jgi:hypothetical protein